MIKITDKKNQIRFDLAIIANLIQPNSKVLDIGCGDGQLLDFLQNNKNVDARGLEISQENVSKAVSKGISVIQGDANKDLAHYPDHHFDYAILSQTIQAMHNPQEILKQILRIADFAIVSLPNFAYYKNRLYLLFKGEMPVRKTIPYQWYNTPNIHFCSINDFSKLCQNMGFAIENTLYLKQNGKLLTSKILPNLLAEFGLFVISKNTTNLVTESNFVFAKYAKANLSTG